MQFRNDTNFRFISVTFETKASIERIKKNYNIHYPVISTTMDSCFLMNFNSGFPTKIISDPSGKVAYYVCGGSVNPKNAQDSIAKNIIPLLKELLNKVN